MDKSLVKKIGEVGQDNLIAKLFPPAETFGVNIAAGQGLLARGTVLALTESGTYIVLGSETPAEGETEAIHAEANCVLADPADASGANSAMAVAYRTGHLNSKALIVAESYTMTIKDRESLRKGGILLSEMMD